MSAKSLDFARSPIHVPRPKVRCWCPDLKYVPRSIRARTYFRSGQAATGTSSTVLYCMPRPKVRSTINGTTIVYYLWYGLLDAPTQSTFHALLHSLYATCSMYVDIHVVLWYGGILYTNAPEIGVRLRENSALLGLDWFPTKISHSRQRSATVLRYVLQVLPYY